MLVSATFIPPFLLILSTLAKCSVPRRGPTKAKKPALLGWLGWTMKPLGKHGGSHEIFMDDSDDSWHEKHINFWKSSIFVNSASISIGMWCSLNVKALAVSLRQGHEIQGWNHKLYHPVTFRPINMATLTFLAIASSKTNYEKYQPRFAHTIILSLPTDGAGV